jgi:enoyl-CoA hydratase
MGKLKMSTDTTDVIAERAGQLGLITLNRPKALNALSLAMVRELSHILLTWQEDAAIKAVVVRGSNKEGPFGAYCAGGDIRYFHQAALTGDVTLEDFFTEEYSLNHLIHNYPKPYIALMEGIVMGGGMGISQGTRYRLVTEHTKMAMPETHIGLFPDVGGGYFLSRCPGSTGEWLALTGATLNAAGAMELGLADYCLNAASLDAAWAALGAMDFGNAQRLTAWLAEFSVAPSMASTGPSPQGPRQPTPLTLMLLLRPVRLMAPSKAIRSSSLPQLRQPAAVQSRRQIGGFPATAAALTALARQGFPAPPAFPAPFGRSGDCRPCRR